MTEIFQMLRRMNETMGTGRDVEDAETEELGTVTAVVSFTEGFGDQLDWEG